MTTSRPALVPTWLAFAVTRLLEEHFGTSSTTTSPPRWKRTSTGSPMATRSGSPGCGGSTTATRRSRSRGCGILVDDHGEIDAREISTIPIKGASSCASAATARMSKRSPTPTASRWPNRAGRPSATISPPTSSPRRSPGPPWRPAPTTAGCSARTPTAGQLRRRQGRAVRPLCHRGPPLRGRRPRPAAPRCSGHGARLDRPGHGGPAAVPARVVGVDPASQEEITAQNGRYGPYLKKGSDSRSLTSESALFEITLDEGAGHLRPAEDPRPIGGRPAAA